MRLGSMYEMSSLELFAMFFVILENQDEIVF